MTNQTSQSSATNPATHLNLDIGWVKRGAPIEQNNDGFQFDGWVTVHLNPVGSA